MTRSLLVFTVVLAALSGCAYPSPGDKAGETPPQIVIRNDVRTWDRPGAFGPVPETLRERAAQTCASLDTDKVKHEARGYHAGALNLEGKPFAGGGYYCTPKR